MNWIGISAGSGRKDVVIVILLRIKLLPLAMIYSFSFISCSNSQEGSHHELVAVDPSLSILGNPSRLLWVTCNYTSSETELSERSSYSRDEVRLAALRALIDLQLKHFGVHPNEAANNLSPLAIDHPFIEVEKWGEQSIVLLATLSDSPDEVERISPSIPPTRYWHVEEFTFQRNGKLISRKATLEEDFHSGSHDRTQALIAD